eukprot:2365490-Pleurochrysis_carterae.AAC.1
MFLHIPTATTASYYLRLTYITYSCRYSTPLTGPEVYLNLRNYIAATQQIAFRRLSLSLAKRKEFQDDFQPKPSEFSGKGLRCSWPFEARPPLCAGLAARCGSKRRGRAESARGGGAAGA